MLASASTLVALSALLAGVRGQNYTTNSSCPTGPTYADGAAAWGSAGSLPPIDAAGTLTNNASADYSWLYSVQRDGKTNWTLAVPAGSPLPDSNSYWSICAVQLLPTTNVVERAQADNGSCRTALDDACVDGLLNQARNNVTTATYNNGGPPPADGPSTAQTCDHLLRVVSNYLGASDSPCYKFFINSTSAAAVTVNSARQSDKQVCPEISTKISPGSTLISTGYTLDRPLRNIFAGDGNNSLYYENARNVKPVLTMYVRNPPLEGGVYTTTAQGQFSGMNCVRVTNYSSADQEPPALPSPTPVSAAQRLINPQGSVLVGAAVVAIITSFVLSASVVL